MSQEKHQECMQKIYALLNEYNATLTDVNAIIKHMGEHTKRTADETVLKFGESYVQYRIEC